MSIEKRAHARIAVPITAHLVVGSQETQLVVRDISKGGVFLYTAIAPGVVGSQVTVKLALSSGIKPVVVGGKLARIISDPATKGRTTLGVGIRFSGNDAPTERALVELIERAMMGPGTRNRAFPRVYYLIDVLCRRKEDFKALLRDIGEGGAGLTVDRAMTKDDELVVEIREPRTLSTLKLKGWVVSCEGVPERPGSYRVGVRFAFQAPAVRKQLQAFISSLVRK